MVTVAHVPFVLSTLMLLLVLRARLVQIVQLVLISLPLEVRRLLLATLVPLVTTLPLQAQHARCAQQVTLRLRLVRPHVIHVLVGTAVQLPTCLVSILVVPQS